MQKCTFSKLLGIKKQVLPQFLSKLKLWKLRFAKGAAHKTQFEHLVI